MNGGVGHTAGLYTSTRDNDEAIRRQQAFQEAVPVHRVLVNLPTSVGAIGTSFNFSIDPSFTLGVGKIVLQQRSLIQISLYLTLLSLLLGTGAGSSMSSNLGPMHLVNISTVARRQNHMEWLRVSVKLFIILVIFSVGLQPLRPLSQSCLPSFTTTEVASKKDCAGLLLEEPRRLSL